MNYASYSTYLDNYRLFAYINVKYPGNIFSTFYTVFLASDPLLVKLIRQSWFILVREKHNGYIRRAQLGTLMSRDF